MSRTRSLANLRADAYKRAGLENGTALCPPADVTEYINQGIAKYHGLLVLAKGDSYFATFKDLVTTTASSYALEADFAYVVSVRANINGANAWLTEFNFSEESALSDTSVNWAGMPFRYRVIASTIQFLPVPTAGTAIRVWYIPSATRLVADGDVFDGVDGWETFVIDWAARRMAEKDENYELCARLDGSIAETRDEIQTLAGKRDLSAPSRIVDRTLARGRAPWGRRRW